MRNRIWRYTDESLTFGATAKVRDCKGGFDSVCHARGKTPTEAIDNVRAKAKALDVMIRGEIAIVTLK